MKWNVSGVVLFASLVSGCAGATSYGSRPLDIHSDGVDIFGCLPDDEGEFVAVADAAIYPASLSGEIPSTAWEITLSEGNPPLRLAPGECVVYRKLPDGYENVSPPGDIEEGWPYEFVVRSPDWGRHRTRIHASSFCLRKSASGIDVVEIPEGPSVVTVDACKQLLDTGHWQR